MKNNVIFMAGIDTGIGKTIVTGLAARYYLSKGISVITQKMVQTGCDTISEDILIHRRLMGIPASKEDLAHETCPYLFQHPASPHLAAEMENRSIDPEKISEQTGQLARQFDLILLEGAGGLMVPLTRQTTILDYVEEKKYPVILTTCARLGSINHTLLSLDALERRGIPVKAVVYNTYPETDSFISKDSITIIREYLSGRWPECPVIQIGQIDSDHPEMPEFPV